MLKMDVMWNSLDEEIYFNLSFNEVLFIFRNIIQIKEHFTGNLLI